ncbi:MAG: conjugal transfer protein TraD [Methylocystaceae bacterium]|nr:conjugal transfer protein TraD [Methylocystaceae bacterium]NBT97511.1 conjugal transfer protein TraD [Methylocystaceae bacterium]
MNRRERTRQLIELGGLVKKSGFIEESKDDRALLLGLLLSVTRNLMHPQNAGLFNAWREEGSAVLNNKKKLP